MSQGLPTAGYRSRSGSSIPRQPAFLSKMSFRFLPSTAAAATGVSPTERICVNGTGCATGTRDLAEYAPPTVYRDGMGMITYPDDQQTSNPLSHFIKQTGGPGVLASPPVSRPRISRSAMPD